MGTAVLLESPHFQQFNSPLKSSSPSSQSYILSIASLPNHYAASLSSPSTAIDIYDKKTLRGVQTLPGHDLFTTSLHSVQRIGTEMRSSLISSGRDGSVKVWDDRTGEHSIKMTNLGKARPLLCVDVSPDGLTVAAGTDLQGDDALILYWDPRQPAAPIRTHGSTHSDDITCLSFSQEQDLPHNTLLSGSSDGLLSISNADEDDEDEAVIQVSNWGCSVSQAGWIHEPSSQKAKIWAASDMETFSTWSAEMDQLMSLDIRDPSVHNFGRTWVTDYLVTCHSTSSTVPNLSVFVGSNEGDVALLSNLNNSVKDAPWYMHRMWSNGHVGIVRSLLWDEENNVIITGGEDSKLQMWACPPVKMMANGSDGDSMDVDSPPRKRDLDREEEQEGKRARR